MIYKAATTATRCERCDTYNLSENEHGKKDERISKIAENPYCARILCQARTESRVSRLTSGLRPIRNTEKRMTGYLLCGEADL